MQRVHVAGLLLALSGFATAQTAPAPIIIWAGTQVPVSESSGRPDSAPSPGVGKPKFADGTPTSRISPVLGTGFGVWYTWPDARNLDMPFTLVWRFPAPGIVDPRTGTTSVEYRELRNSRRCTDKSSCLAAWTLDGPHEIVPGKWTVELLVKDAEPVTFSFELLER